MKKIICLVLLVLIAQTSLANDWFPQQPTEESKPDTKSPTEEDMGKMVMLRSPCDKLPKMLETVKRYKETLLFTATGLTFSAQFGQPYRGAMFFYVNQDTGSYTVLQVFKDGMACMLINGKNFDPFTGEEK